MHGNVLSGKVNAKVCSVKRTESLEQHETHSDDPGPSTSKTTSIDESTENSDNGGIINMTQNKFISSFKRPKTIHESFAFLNSFKDGGHKSKNYPCNNVHGVQR